MNATISDIQTWLRSNTFNVYLKLAPDAQATYRVIGARVKEGQPQVKTVSSRAKKGYLWWNTTPEMTVYTQ